MIQKMEFFFDVGLTVDPLDPPKFTPSLDPPWRSVHWAIPGSIVVEYGEIDDNSVGRDLEKPENLSDCQWCDK